VSAKPADLILLLERAWKKRTGKTPFPYQRVDARWLSKRRRGMAFHDPGLGKTLIILLALPLHAPVLVSGPGIAKGKWAKDILEARPDLRPYIVDGRRGFRWPMPGEVAIVNWEGLPYSYREYRNAYLRSLSKSAAVRAEVRHKLRLIRRSRARMTLPHPGTVVVGDELHRCMNPKAFTTIRWRELSAMALHHGGRSWGATGTPLVNRRKELYEVLQAAGLGERAFGSIEEFERLADEDPDEFNRRMRLVSVRRSRADVLPWLPPKTREILPVKLDAAVALRCDQLVAAMRAQGLSLKSLDLAALRMLAAPKSPLRMAVSTVREALAQAKIPAAMELLDELEAQGERSIVVGSAHRKAADEIGARKGWTKITGGEDHAEKFKRAEAFQRGEFDGVAVTYQSAGEAIDLYRGWRSVQVDLPWTMKALDQFESRRQRIGTTATGLLFTWIVADHELEERVAEILRDKAAEIEKHVEASARKSRANLAARTKRPDTVAT
jgi:SNF2 family DNA or RNA helicase